MISCPEAVESLLWLTVTVCDEKISVEENSYQSEVKMFTFDEKSDYTQTKRL